MGILSGISDLIGLDIGDSVIRLAQLKFAGSRYILVGYGEVPVDQQLVTSETPENQQKLADLLRGALEHYRLTSSNVVMGLSSSRVFSTVINVDESRPVDIARVIPFQASSVIPTKADETKLDWSILGPSVLEPNKTEILLSSTTNDFIEQRLDLLEGVGLQVVAFEPNPVALSRAIIGQQDLDTQIIINMDGRLTDIVVIFDQAPRLIRSNQVGLWHLIKSVSDSLGMGDQEAWLAVFNEGASGDAEQNQVKSIITRRLQTLIDEIKQSIKFFESRYTDKKIAKINLTGYLAHIPEIPSYLAEECQLPVVLGSAWNNVGCPPEMARNISGLGSYYVVPVGLAERKI